MPNTTQSVTWDELLDSIATGAAHPDDTNWKIYRYLQNNYKTIGSVTARTLLAAYMKLHVKRMSLVDSCMLGMAVKISETYGDFKLSKFLEAWGYDSCLRAQDLQAISVAQRTRGACPSIVQASSSRRMQWRV